MATLKSVAVTLPSDKVPTKRMIRDIVGAFLTREWSSIDPESLQISHRVNFANAHCPVERPITAKGASVEPLRVFIKFHERPESNIDIFKHLAPTKEQEALLCHEFTELSYGAKVHGFFQTEDGTLGRIDEFLDAHNMEPEDVENADIRTDIAKAMANFAAMESSVHKTSVAVYYDAVVSGLQKYHKLGKLKALAEEGGISLESLIDFDFASRLKIVVDAMEAMKAKTGWCTHDVQFRNTMVKNHPRPNEKKVALIDFELVMRNYRCFDIGGHFMQKMFKWFDEENTGEQVLREAEYGYMLAITFDIHNMLWFMAKMDSKDPLDLEALNKLYDDFAGQYRKLGLKYTR